MVFAVVELNTTNPLVKAVLWCDSVLVGNPWQIMTNEEMMYRTIQTWNEEAEEEVLTLTMTEETMLHK